MDDTQRRIAALEASVASVSATVEGLAAEWRTERTDLKNSIQSINTKLDQSKAGWKDMIPLLSICLVIITIASGFVVREITRLSSTDDKIIARMEVDNTRERLDAAHFADLDARIQGLSQDIEAANAMNREQHTHIHGEIDAMDRMRTHIQDQNEKRVEEIEDWQHEVMDFMGAFRSEMREKYGAMHHRLNKVEAEQDRRTNRVYGDS